MTTPTSSEDCNLTEDEVFRIQYALRDHISRHTDAKFNGDIVKKVYLLAGMDPSQ